ncbi:MGAM [Branchiostoma lanceolatum]|uniref:alpha-glucosidase n=1 Tax=Branchiostoma lanceolatum TaxID=7740 RepID=A0A8J9Z205_BRALA|nr:MGAM [Branchiostoma lanceolatum]
MPVEESSPGRSVEDPKNEKSGFSSPRWRVVLIVACVVVAALLVIIVPTAVVLTRTDRLDPVCPAMDERERVDCHPEGKAARDRCEARGCCWSPAATQGPPSCFYPTNHGYEVDGAVVKTASGYRARLRRLKTPTMYGGDVETVELLVEMQEEHRLHVKILDPAEARYEVPEAALRVPRPGQAADSPMYDVTFTHRPFSFKVTRRSTGATIFDTSVGKLTFGDQFLSVSTRLASSNLYGLGEHVHRRYRHDLNWKTWPIFASGANPFGNYENLYGHHPFYMCLEDDGKANGVMLLNSNAMDVTLQPGAPDSAPIVTYRVIGGVLDFYMFLGPSPENVVQQYTELIGRPVMPAYWGLGFQLCRWNYTNTAGLREVIERNRATGIPYDVQYGDIDYMEDRKDFTYDADLYQGLPDLVQDLHDHGQKYIIILDPAITNQDRRDGSPYQPYEDGLRDGVFVKAADGETNLIGEVWPGTTLFPDYTNPSTTEWWSEYCQRFHNVIPYDGLWIDMNEPKSFMNGSNNGCESNRWNYPPFKPAIVGRIMYDLTLCMDARQTWGKHYDVHSLYGHSMAIATRSAMSRVFPTKRGVIITRSSFPSTGSYAGHWLGSNKAAWEDMEWSIPALFELNLFGIPYIGADICGFLWEPTEELCQRWMQLGAFYPFSRNHNHREYKDQDPAVFSQSMIDSTRDVMMTRYTLLPYLYTLFYHAHVAGTTVVRPLLHEFPTDSNTWDVDRQFLWGSGLLISPVLTPNTTTVSAYFPDTPWYDYYTGQEVEGEYRGQTVTLDAPMNKINVHVRGGTILPTQQPANTTVYSRKNPMGLLVAMDDSSAASGTLFWDDGEAVDSIERKDYLFVNLSASSTELTCDVVALPLGGPTAGHWAALRYGTVSVYGLALGTGTPTVRAGRVDGPLQTVAASRVQYDRDNQVLLLTDLQAMDLPITESLRFSWT